MTSWAIIFILQNSTPPPPLFTRSAHKKAEFTMIPMQGPTILTCLNHYVRECPDTRALHSQNRGSLMRFGVWCPSISLHHHDLNAKKKGKSETLGNKYIGHVWKVSKCCHFVRIVMEPMPTASSHTHMIFNHWLTLTILQLVIFGHLLYLEVILDPF
jgi:hypothetical protein